MDKASNNKKIPKLLINIDTEKSNYFVRDSKLLLLDRFDAIGDTRGFDAALIPLFAISRSVGMCRVGALLVISGVFGWVSPGCFGADCDWWVDLDEFIDAEVVDCCAEHWFCGDEFDTGCGCRVGFEFDDLLSEEICCACSIDIDWTIGWRILTLRDIVWYKSLYSFMSIIIPRMYMDLTRWPWALECMTEQSSIRFWSIEMVATGLSQNFIILWHMIQLQNLWWHIVVDLTVSRNVWQSSLIRRKMCDLIMCLWIAQFVSSEQKIYNYWEN